MTRRRTHAASAALLLSAIVLAGCSDHPAPSATPPAIDATAPQPRPDRPVVDQAELRRTRAEKARKANAAAASAAETPASRTMRKYLQTVEQTLRAQGKLRTDGGLEVPMTPESLTEDFVRIALYDEYSRQGDALVSRATPAPLRRWTQPVRMHVEFGDSVAPAQRNRDRADIAALAARLQSATGNRVSLSPDSGNFTIMILSEDERRAIGPRLTELVPGIPAADVEALVNLSPQNYCTVFAYSRGAASTYVHAVALIRSETPPLLRRSCFHEELTQGMGVANDSSQVRPSIFNDDEEFAYLTPHDELLLKILYDPRLRPGMSEAEARPIVLQIARELLGARA